MSRDDYEDKYTEPDLRRKIKDELMASDKGGQPGEWSSRKSQLLAQEYERQGGGYKHKEKDKAARSLEEWQEQDWQTVEGDANAREGEITKRYLPKEVWDSLSPAEKREAERAKERGSQRGAQHVDYTPAIKRAMHEMERDHDAQHEPSKGELYDRAKELNIEGRSTMSKDELLDAVRKAAK